ncbi:MAG: hypothetical protein QF464_01210 [Myxococcota bacterium]|jgi:hypothetical protein|nr:hypothetical protein [Myxococcota bacterium]
MLRTFPVILLCLPVLCLVACDGWEADEAYTMPVFSDDGEGIAAVKHSFRAKDALTHIKQKDFQVQLLMKENLSATAPQALTGLLPGMAIEVFFMRSEGYLVLGRHTDWLGSYEGGSQAIVTYEKVALDGTLTTIASGTYPVSISCGDDQGQTNVAPQLRVVPSPDGGLLAMYESEITCAERVQTVTFLDAASLDVVGGPFDVPAPAPDTFGGVVSWKPVDMGWTTAGAFATGFWGHGPDFSHYWVTLFRPDEAPLADQVLGMDCLHPATTSSGNDAEGLTVHIDETTGAIGFQGPTPGPGGGLAPSGAAFGCAE